MKKQIKYKLYHGSSPYLSLDMAHEYIQERVETDFPQVILDGESLFSQTILDTLSSQSLFSSQRIFFLKRLYRNKDKSNLIEKVIEILNKEENLDIFVFWEDQKIKSNTKYFKFFKERDAIEEIPELNKRTFFTWLRKELEKRGLNIDQTVIKELAERTNYDPQRCSNELAKFKLNNSKKIIDRSDIETLTTNTLEKDIWGLIEAINNNDKITSIKILENLKSQFVDSNYILSMLARNLRLLFLTKSLVDKGKDYREISSTLKIPPFTTPSLIKSSSHYSYEKIKMLYTKLANLDLQIKRGQIDGMLGLTLICPHL